jgi:nucleotidyltransferase/DNA polymerase involved in DNA repair
MPIRKALSLCPDAAVLPPDPVLYRGIWEAVLRALGAVTPEIEDEGLGRAYLNVGGLAPHYGSEEALARSVIQAVCESSGLSAAAGIASSKFPAFAAANFIAPGEVRVIGAGQAAEFFGSLDVALLPLEAEVSSRLKLLGLETLGDVARLSVSELQGQFGSIGERLWKLANGIDEEPLIPRIIEETVEAGLAFEAPVAGTDVMIAAARQLLSRLRAPLRGRAAREMTLQSELISGRGWAKQIVLREAVSEDQRLAFVLRSTLSNFPPPAAIKSISLRLSGLIGETGKQLVLGERGRMQRQLEEAIQQLKARYGYSPIFRCVEVESWSVIPEERQILVESDG